MSIGATLAAARRRAGLSVVEVSQRASVPGDVVQGIEHDDYADGPHARDQIRAIAGAVGTDPGPLIEEFDETWGSVPEVTAAEALPPEIEMPPRTRERRRVRWTAALGVLVLAVLGFAVYKAVSGTGPAPKPAAAGQSPAAGGPAGSASAGVQGSTAPVSSATPSPSASASTSLSASQAAPSPSASPVPVSNLAVAQVSAFGPGGGDHPEQAALALSGNPATPWHTKWYATPDFGLLYSGTGLLIDMGRTVTVSSVRVSLGIPGASFQLRAGDRPDAASLRTVATSAGAGGTVQLTLSSPPAARYLLVWFTRLPPDGAGHYQGSIYQIVVRGSR